MGQRREFSAQEIELVTSLWNAGEPTENICRLAGVSKDTLDYHRQCGVFTHLPRRVKGSGRKKARLDDESKQQLFGMPREEWQARRDAIRNKWSSDEAHERSKGIAPHSRKAHISRRADEDLETTYNPGRDDSRAPHIRHVSTPHRIQAEERYHAA